MKGSNSMISRISGFLIFVIFFSLPFVVPNTTCSAEPLTSRSGESLNYYEKFKETFWKYNKLDSNHKKNNVDYWGEDVFLFPETVYKCERRKDKENFLKRWKRTNKKESCKSSWEKIKKSAVCSILDPVVLVPTAAALLLTPDNWDEEISDWAADHNPIFGSRTKARDASDFLAKKVLPYEAIGTYFFAAVGDMVFNNKSFFHELGIGLVEGGAFGAAGGITKVLKNEVGRRRPNGEDHKSFPSGHTSTAFSLATISNHNIDGLIKTKPKYDNNGERIWQNIDTLRVGLQAVNIGIASSAGWARVEAKKHHVVDILAGAAIGRFCTSFIQNTWLKQYNQYEQRASVDVSVQKDGAAIAFSWSR